MAETALQVLADIEPFEAQIAKIEPAAAAAAKKAGQVISREFATAGKHTGSAAQAAESAWAKAGAGIKRSLNGLGFGGVVGDVEDLVGGLGALGPAAAGLAVVAGGAAAAAAALVGVTRAGADAVDRLDELGLSDAVTPEQRDRIERANAALDALWVVADEFAVTMAADVGPSVESAATSLAQLGLDTLHTLQAFTSAHDVIEEFEILVGDSLVKALLAPVTGIVELGRWVGMLADAVGIHDNGLLKLADAYDEWTRATAASKLGIDGLDNATDASNESTGEAAELVGRLAAHRHAESKAAKDQEEAEKALRRAYEEQQKDIGKLFDIAHQAALDAMGPEERLTAEYHDRIAIIEDLAEKTGYAGAAQKAIADTTAAYFNEREKMAEEAFKKEAEAADKAKKAQLDAQAEINEAINRVREAEQEKLQEQIDGIFGAAQSVQQALGDLFADQFARESEVIERLKKARQRAAADGNKAEVASIDAKLKAEKQAGRTWFRAEKAARLSGVAMDTAQAIMAALTLPPPAGPIAATAAGIAGGIQAAVIARQKSPYHTGGSVRAPDEVDIRARQGEYVVREGAARENKAALDELNRTGSMPATQVSVVQLDGRTMGAIVAQAVKAPGPLRQEIERIAKGVLANSSQGYAR